MYFILEIVAKKLWLCILSCPLLPKLYCLFFSARLLLPGFLPGFHCPAFTAGLLLPVFPAAHFGADPLEGIVGGFFISVEDVGAAKDFRTFGNFTAATAIHLGDYADIMQTHVRLVQWINKNHYRIVGPVSEEFIISPLDINNASEHVTKIIIPVEKIEKNQSEPEE
jgi:hypothetical protein